MKIAILADYDDCLRLLISAKADIDDSSEPEMLLPNCVRLGHVNSLRVLLESKSNYKACDRSGKTPLDLAVENRRPRCVSELVKVSGQDKKELSERVYGLVKLARKLARRQNSKEEINLATIRAAQNDLFLKVVDFLEKGLDIDSQDRYGGTCLTYSTLFGKLDVVQLLLRKNADPNIVTGNGCSAITFAAMLGFENIVELLAASGAEVTITDFDGYTPLDWARRQGNDKCAAVLMKYQA